MPDALTCPACHAVGDPAALVEDLAICRACGATVKIFGDGVVRRATYADTAGLSVVELRQLQAARGNIVRPDRRR